MEQFIFEERDLSVAEDGSRRLRIHGEEHFHLSRVLRVKVGEKVLATNGAGITFLCAVARVEKNGSLCEVLERYVELNAPSRKYYIGIALLKPVSKCELVVEKCTELGASGFILFASERSGKTYPRLERLKGITRSAMKQSLRSRFPELIIAADMKDVIARTAGFDRKIVMHEKSSEMFGSFVSHLPSGESAAALLGPEGGFSGDEISFLKDNGYRDFSLGSARLRSETAAIKTASLLSTF